MASRRRCCCGAGAGGCDACYFVENPSYDCSICADSDTATVDLNVSFTPYQWGAVDNYTGCANWIGPNTSITLSACGGPEGCNIFTRDANYACYDCLDAVVDTGVAWLRDCCPGQCGGGQCVETDISTNPSIKFLCNRFNYRIYNFVNPESLNCATVSCGFKSLRYTFPDVIFRRTASGQHEANCPNPPGTIQYFPEIVTDINRRCVFKRKRGFICSPGAVEEPQFSGTCGHVEIEDVGGSIILSQQVTDQNTPGDPDNIELAQYIHCTQILQNPGPLTCPIISGLYLSPEFFQYLNPDNNANRKFSILKIITNFHHKRPIAESFNENNVPCCSSLSSVINQASTENKIHAQGILYYFREIPECAITNRDDYCFNRGLYRLGYIKFGYPLQQTSFGGKAWYQSNPLVSTVTEVSYNIGQRLYNTCNGQNVPGVTEGTPNTPNLRTDFSYPNEITLV